MAMTTSLGLMSGTSLDGIDAALIRTDGHRRVETGAHLTVPYEAGFRQRLRAIKCSRNLLRLGARFPGDSDDVDNALRRGGRLSVSGKRRERDEGREEQGGADAFHGGW